MHYTTDENKSFFIPWPAVNDEVYAYHLNKADKSMIKNYLNKMTDMHDQKKKDNVICQLVCAANEYIFSNISDLIKSAAESHDIADCFAG